MANLPICDRCGICCRKGGPALHEEDLGLLDTLGLTSLVCLRKGEPAYDPRVDAVRPLPQEVIKIRGKGNGWECLYYDAAGSGCTIYAHRPLECRALSCKETAMLFAAMETLYLHRGHFVRPDSALWACIKEHEQQFSLSQVIPWAECSSKKVQIPGELDHIFRAERAYRLTLADHIQGQDEDLWPYLGRPLWLVLAPYDSRFLEYGKKA